MKKLLNIAIGIGFCLIFCFLAVGYAALNDELHVTGTVSYEYVPEETLYPGDDVVDKINGAEPGVYIGHGTDEGDAGSKAHSFPLYKTQNGVYYSIIDTSESNLPYLSRYLNSLDNKNEEIDTQILLCVLPDDATKIDLALYIVKPEDEKNQWKSIELNLDNFWNQSDTKENIQFEENSKYVLYFYDVTSETGNDRNGGWELVETGSSSNTPETTAFTLDTTAVTNLTIESQEVQTMDLSSRPNLLLTLTPAEGHLLPETFTVTISCTEYAISTAGENETETMFWDAEANTLYILGDILPTDGTPVVVTAHAVPEVPGFTLNTDMLKFMAVEWHTANGCLNLSLTPEEGYLLPETIIVTINDIPYTICTTPEEENPAGMGYDPIENVLTIHLSLIPQNAQIILTAEAVPESNEEETEPTKEVTDPTEETTEPTGEPTDPTEETTEPTGEPTDPTEETTEPTGEPTDPTEETTEPTGEPTDPTEETTAPTEESTNPTEETTEPTEESTDSTEETTEPTEESTDPTEETSTPTEECTVSADDGADSEHH